MHAVMLAKIVLSTCLLLGAAVVVAADEEAAIKFNLPPAQEAQEINAECNQSLDIDRLLTDDELLTALTSGVSDVAQVLDSVFAIQNKISGIGNGAEGLVVNRVRSRVAQCESGCVVLPQGSRIKEIRTSPRTERGVTSVEFPANPIPHGTDPLLRKMSQPMFRMTQEIFGDLSGYRNSLVSGDHRAMCITAVNLSQMEPTSQVVRVIFER